MPLRRQLLRRNMHSWRWWLGCSLLCVLPPADTVAAERVVVTRVAAPTKMTRTLVLGGGALGGCVAGLIALRLLANPVAVRNLRAVLASHHLCPHCGHDLPGNAGVACPGCGAPATGAPTVGS